MDYQPIGPYDLVVALHASLADPIPTMDPNPPPLPHDVAPPALPTSSKSDEEAEKASEVTYAPLPVVNVADVQFLDTEGGQVESVLEIDATSLATEGDSVSVTITLPAMGPGIDVATPGQSHPVTHETPPGEALAIANVAEVRYIECAMLK